MGNHVEKLLFATFLMLFGKKKIFFCLNESKKFLPLHPKIKLLTFKINIRHDKSRNRSSNR